MTGAIGAVKTISRAVTQGGGAATSGLLQKVLDLSIKYFSAAAGGFLTLFGVKEMVFDGAYQRWHMIRRVKPTTNEKVSNATKWFTEQANELRKQTIDHRSMHGVAYTASGVTTGLAGMHSAKWIDVGRAFPILDKLGNIFFIISNMFVLHQSIHTFTKASAMAEFQETPAQKNMVSELKRMAFAGIISSLSYIWGTALFLLGAPVALALVLGGIGVTFGAFKIIYETLVTDPHLTRITEK